MHTDGQLCIFCHQSLGLARIDRLVDSSWFSATCWADAPVLVMSLSFSSSYPVGHHCRCRRCPFRPSWLSFHFPSSSSCRFLLARYPNISGSVAAFTQVHRSKDTGFTFDLTRFFIMFITACFAMLATATGLEGVEWADPVRIGLLGSKCACNRACYLHINNCITA